MQAVEESMIVRDRGRSVFWQSALAVTWGPALVTAVYVAVGRLGFFPTDEGLIQAYSYRILRGEVPHRDFISPRPLGTALLHLVDFVIPGPLFEVGRVVALFEYVVYASLFAWLIYSTAPWRWKLAMVAGAAVSVLLDLNIFPLFSWYTVDGLVLIALGFVVIWRGVERKSTGTILLGFLLVGMAALTKQSYVPATAFGWLLLCPRLGPLDWKARIRELLITGFVAAMPSLAYVCGISVLGGFSALRTQLLGTAFVYGRPLVAAWSPQHDLMYLALFVAAAASASFVIENRQGQRPGDGGAYVLPTRVGFSALVLAVPLWARLGTQGNDWGIWLTWMVIAYVGMRTIVSRSLDVMGALIVCAGWMSSLSYGFPYPNLVGGTLALYLFTRSWQGSSPLHPSLKWLQGIAAPLAAFAVVGFVFVSVRTQDVYLDRPANELTASLDEVSPAFGAIRTNSTTAQYLAQMKDCINRYPANRVAVFPENAAIYPALALKNPFPVDWLWPDDVQGSQARILSRIDVLNSEGDYLVMFQTIDEPTVVRAGTLPDAGPGSPIAAFTPLAGEIYAGLRGVKSTCGTFLVVYSPPAQP